VRAPAPFLPPRSGADASLDISNLVAPAQPLDPGAARVRAGDRGPAATACSRVNLLVRILVSSIRFYSWTRSRPCEPLTSLFQNKVRSRTEMIFRIKYGCIFLNLYDTFFTQSTVLQWNEPRVSKTKMSNITGYAFFFFLTRPSMKVLYPAPRG